MMQNNNFAEREKEVAKKSSCIFALAFIDFAGNNSKR